LIATTIAYPPELNFGQEVIHGDLQCLHYHLADNNTQYPKIGEDIEFPKVVNVMQFPGKTGNRSTRDI
jgi:hypothetical protein